MAQMNKSYLNQMLQPYARYSIEYNVPVFNGEWGVLKNGEVWDKIGGEQYTQDSLDVFKENGINAAYFSYYDRNTNSTQRRAGLRVREFALPYGLQLTADNAILNTTLYNVFSRNKDK